jgi:transcriptional regulator with XRE-family HTH domain
MFEVVGNLAKNNETGVSLPDFVRERLEEMGYRPSWRQLALLSGVPFSTLQANLTGRSETRLGTAKKLAEALTCTVDELCNNTPLS